MLTAGALREKVTENRAAGCECGSEQASLGCPPSAPIGCQKSKGRLPPASVCLARRLLSGLLFLVLRFPSLFLFMVLTAKTSAPLTWQEGSQSHVGDRWPVHTVSLPFYKGPCHPMPTGRPQVRAWVEGWGRGPSSAQSLSGRQEAPEQPLLCL